MCYPLSLAGSGILEWYQRNDQTDVAMGKTTTSTEVQEAPKRVSSRSNAFKVDIILLVAVLIIFGAISKRFENGSVSLATFHVIKIATQTVLATLAITYTWLGINYLRKIAFN